MNKQIEKLYDSFDKYPWHLDHFSTILSRKHSWHICQGVIRIVKVRKTKTTNNEGEK